MANVPFSQDPPATISPWANVGQPDDDQAQKAMAGYHIAVEKGLVTPEEGLARLKKAGLIHKDAAVKDVLPSAQAAPQKGASETEPDENADPSQLWNYMSQPHTLHENTTKEKSENFDQTNAQKRMDFLLQSQPVQSQQADLEKLKNMISMSAQADSQAGPLDHADLGPAVAYLDGIATKPTGMAASYHAPESAAAVKERLLAAAQKVYQDGAGISKEVVAQSGVNQPSGTTETDTQTKQIPPNIVGLQNLLMKQQGMNNLEKFRAASLANQGTKIAQAGQRIDQTASLAGQRTVNNDKILNTYQPRIDGATKILQLMDAAKKGDFKSNQAMLGQINAEISRLETGSQAPGLHSSEKTEMNDAKAKLMNVYDTLTSHVTAVNLDEKFKQAAGMVTELRESYKGQVKNRLKVLKAGSLPNQQKTFDAKTAEYTKDEPAAAAPAATGRVPVIGPNGERKSLPAAQVEAFLKDPEYGGKGWKAVQ